MNKIFLIIRREYLTRVKKRSFLVMTILGPLLMAATIVVPIYLATRSEETKKVAVIDETGIFLEKFKDADNIQFHYLPIDIAAAKANFTKSGDDALLYIPKTEVTLPSNAILYSENSVNISIISYVRNIMGKHIEELKLQARLKEYQTDKNKPIPVDDIMRSVKTTVGINTLKIGEDGKESKSYTELNMVLGMFTGLLIYFFIFMFGSQVMRGVIEEKTSRIVEVIISSVKPFQLMMGKIVGVGLVGLTQFLLWVILTFGIVTVVTTAMSMKNGKKSATEQIMKQSEAMNPAASEALQKQAESGSGDVSEVMEAINSVNFPVMIGSFIFFFLFGYLMYAALFAAIGGAVDSEADTQQFMLPITIPLILSIVMAQYIIRDPDGPLSFWFSIIPLTSPVTMMIRIPFGVPYLQVALSMVLLVLGFLATTWLAGKIYRTGILMYGKKITYKELWKWIRY
ncbi:MAG: ABC transporter permease [Bacteroidetes bacterium]|nr:ABC transporter permease [Bacteroidota bacterium]